MRVAFLVVALAALALCGANQAIAATYGILAAGSKFYSNARHQADVAHAYAVLTNGGVPAENIVLFSYDDIANNPANPMPGFLVNHPGKPGSAEAPNLYPAIKDNIDYKGEDVNPANFLAVLAGDASGVTGGTGRVLESGPDDDVFVYFSDHGAPGLIAFPSSYLYASDLMSTIKSMAANMKFKEMTIYIEACEAGSMFDGLLPDNIHVYATTAATPNQSSYACYYSDIFQTYLGDEYSVRWLEDADVHDTAGSQWTLQQQFEVVANETLQSQPQQYGNLSMSSEKIVDFEGNGDSNVFSQLVRPSRTASFTPCNDGVDSRDVTLEILKRRRNAAHRANDLEAVEALNAQVTAELASRASADHAMTLIVRKAMGSAHRATSLDRKHLPPRDFDCLKGAVASVEKACGKFNDYSLKHIYRLVNLCETGVSVATISDAAVQACSL